MAYIVTVVTDLPTKAAGTSLQVPSGQRSAQIAAALASQTFLLR